MAEKVKVSDLKEHEKNSLFFDGIEGDAWSEFLESVKTSGVIVPIIVTQDNVIVSGHQRVRACKALGIDEIDAEVREFKDEDEIIKQLIETNIRQRGVGNANPVKFGRCLIELERIYGIKNGNNQHNNRVEHNVQPTKTQSELASELGLTVESIKRYKKLAKAIPEMQELVESGKVTKTIALRLLKELSEDEQRQLAVEVSGVDEQLSGREIEFYKKRIKTLTDENKALKEQPPTIKEVEVPPADYEDTKEELSATKEKLSLAEDRETESKEEIDRLYNKIAMIEKKNKKADNLSIDMFVEQCRGFIKTASSQGKTLLKGKKPSEWGDWHECVEVLSELSDWATKFAADISKK